MFYALFGIPLGRLADSWHRGRLIAIGLALWSSMTILSGLATSFAQLAVARVGVGIGEASASPAAYSLLADHFPKRRRALAMALYSAGLYLGMGLSLPLGGWISSRWNRAYAAGGAPLDLAGWQAAFIAVGLPGLVAALWVLSLREPVRGAGDGAPRPISHAGAWREYWREMAAILPPLTLWSVARFPGARRLNLMFALAAAAFAWVLIRLTGDVAQWTGYAIGAYAVASWVQRLQHVDPPAWRLLWLSPGMRLAVPGFGGLGLMIYSVGFWVPPYAIRTFGVDAAHVGVVIGFPAAIGSAIGVVAGGQLSDWWKARDDRGRVFVAMLAAALPMPFAAFMFTTSDFELYCWLSPFVYGLSSLWIGSALACYQEMVLPRMRGTVGAVGILGTTMFGLAIGPYGSGKIATVTGSLQTGIASLYVVPPIVLVLLWLLSRRIGELERTREERAAGG